MERVEKQKISWKEIPSTASHFFEYKKVKAFFIADFYCHEHRLVLEVDGKNHDYQKEYDEYRTHVVNVLGMRVVRFENEQVQKNLNKVLESLSQVLRDGG